MLKKFAFCAVMLAFVGFVTADEKTTAEYPKKIVGVWSFVKGPEQLPPGAKIEFTKDGKLNLTIDLNGKMQTVPVGDYKIKGEVITLTKAGGGKEEPAKITKLTDTELEIVEEGKKEGMVFKRDKGK